LPENHFPEAERMSTVNTLFVKADTMPLPELACATNELGAKASRESGTSETSGETGTNELLALC
jgi:hypothetical protein